MINFGSVRNSPPAVRPPFKTADKQVSGSVPSARRPNPRLSAQTSFRYLRNATPKHLKEAHIFINTKKFPSIKP